MNKLILVTGGARSGKSSYALERCEAIGGRRCFIATCPVIDPEMDDRITAHRIERDGRGWDCREEEVALVQLLPKLKEYDTLLIDCLTLWVNNLLYKAERQKTLFDEQQMRQEASSLVKAVQDFNGTVCLVTNEVGLGVVPDNPLARKYRDLVGGCNRYIATQSQEVVFVSCGIPLMLKHE